MKPPIHVALSWPEEVAIPLMVFTDLITVFIFVCFSSIFHSLHSLCYITILNKAVKNHTRGPPEMPDIKTFLLEIMDRWKYLSFY